MREYIELRIAQPHFANARSIRNALDRARLRQASRLFASAGAARSPEQEQLMLITPRRTSGRAACSASGHDGNAQRIVMYAENVHVHTAAPRNEVSHRDSCKGSADSNALTALLVDVAAAMQAHQRDLGKGALGERLGTLDTSTSRAKRR